MSMLVYFGVVWYTWDVINKDCATKGDIMSTLERKHYEFAKPVYYGESKEIDSKVEAMIDREIECCQSALVDMLFEKMVFEWDDVENLYTSSDDLEDDEEPDNPKEVLEWWKVSKWALKKLREQGEPVLDNDYGEWWGRTCSGQSICLDPTWYDIRHRILYS